jgi:cytochrome c5
MAHKIHLVTLVFCLLLLNLVSCTADQPASPTVTDEHTPMMSETPGAGMGMSSLSTGMRDRHHTRIPDEYARLTNPIAADETSLARGAEIYTTHCLSCHGESGMGDGVASATLEPAPAPISYTSRRMGDGYLFWRVTEGGLPFETAMPAWKDILTEEARWDVINYLRSIEPVTTN